MIDVMPMQVVVVEVVVIRGVSAARMYLQQPMPVVPEEGALVSPAP
jgi:hypothetical protein